MNTQYRTYIHSQMFKWTRCTLIYDENFRMAAIRTPKCSHPHTDLIPCRSSKSLFNISTIWKAASIVVLNIIVGRAKKLYPNECENIREDYC